MMIRKAVLIAAILSNTVFAGVSVKSEMVPTTPPIIYVDGLNSGLDLDKVSIYDISKYVNRGVRHELFQNLPVQFIDDSDRVWTIRIKDIVSYRFTEGNSKIIVTIKGTDYREYGYIDLTIDDIEYVKFIINLFKTQQKIILESIQN